MVGEATQRKLQDKQKYFLLTIYLNAGAAYGVPQIYATYVQRRKRDRDVFERGNKIQHAPLPLCPPSPALLHTQFLPGSPCFHPPSHLQSAPLCQLTRTGTVGQLWPVVVLAP